MARPASGRPRPADFLDSRPQLNPRGLVLPAHPGPHGSPGPGLRPCCPYPALGRAPALGMFTPCQPPGGNEQSQRGRVPDDGVEPTEGGPQVRAGTRGPPRTHVTGPEHQGARRPAHTLQPGGDGGVPGGRGPTLSEQKQAEGLRAAQNPPARELPPWEHTDGGPGPPPARRSRAAPGLASSGWGRPGLRRGNWLQGRL